jgi:hypothetical protein
VDFQYRRPILFSIPGLALSLIPKIGCPLCWGLQIGYAGALLSTHIFVSRHVGLLVVVAMNTSWIVLAWKGKRRDSYKSLAAVTGLYGLILLGNAASKSTWMTCLGSLALLGASVWIYCTKLASCSDANATHYANGQVMNCSCFSTPESRSSKAE